MMHKALSAKKVATKVIGQTLLFGIIVICTVGAIMSLHKDIGAEANFCGLHSWLGIVTLALYPIQWFCVSWVFYQMQGEEEQPRRPMSCKEYVCLGLGLGIYFIVGFGTLVTGLLEKPKFHQKEKAWKFSTNPLTVSFAVIGIVLLVVMTVWIKSEVEEAQENGDDGLPI